MSNGDIWTAMISYNGTALSMTLWDTTGEGSPYTIYTSLPINIASFLGTTNAYVGFTGGTGSGFEQQDILKWQLSNSATLTGTPEPATLGLVFAGIAGIAFVKRRRGAQR
jgi:Na+/glutamate symporter